MGGGAWGAGGISSLCTDLSTRLLGLGGSALGLASALLGFGDAFLHLTQAPFMLGFFQLQPRQAFRLGSAILGSFGPLFDLA